MRKFRVLDLFSGIGGFSLAADWMGWETVAFCERESFPRKVLAKHWPGVHIHDDVKKIEEFDQYAGAVELICGGYPCQPFSVAGKQRGAADDRHLWPAMFEIIKRVRPRWVVGENVAGHIRMGLDSVLSDLESEGYTARAFVIPACAVNAQHRRDRVWIIANSSYGYEGPPSGETPTKPESSNNNNNKPTPNAQGQRCDTGRLPERTAPALSDAEIGDKSVSPNTSGQGLQIESITEINGKTETGEGGGRSVTGTPNATRNLRQTQPGICGSLDGIPPVLDRDIKIPGYTARIKALGNAIVPQVAYQIFKAIQEAENDIQT